MTTLYTEDFMITIVIRTFIIYITLALTLRVMGKRQIGELEVSELIVTFMLSELATIPIADTNAPLLCAVIPILLLLSIEGMLSFITVKVPLFKKLIYGEPSILIHQGKINQKELRDQRIELSELMCAIRQNGISSLGDVSCAILEENGKISVFPKPSKSALTPEQAKITVSDPDIGLPLIMDRRIIKDNLNVCGWSMSRLEKALSSRHLNIDDVFFLSVDSSNSIYIIKKERNK